jgi:hypothetical protein
LVGQKAIDQQPIYPQQGSNPLDNLLKTVLQGCIAGQVGDDGHELSEKGAGARGLVGMVRHGKGAACGRIERSLGKIVDRGSAVRIT